MSNFSGGKTRQTESTETGPGIAGKDSMGRRVWDKEYFKSQYESCQMTTSGTSKLVTGAIETLKSRDESVDLSSVVNERRIVTNSSEKSQQGGFYCKTCDCLLKDSTAYYDHVNGKSHNRLLGMSMQVEKVTLERVIAKLKFLRSNNVGKKVDRDEVETLPEKKKKKRLVQNVVDQTETGVLEDEEIEVFRFR